MGCFKFKQLNKNIEVKKKFSHFECSKQTLKIINFYFKIGFCVFFRSEKKYIIFPLIAFYC